MGDPGAMGEPAGDWGGGEGSLPKASILTGSEGSDVLPWVGLNIVMCVDISSDTRQQVHRRVQQLVIVEPESVGQQPAISQNPEKILNK